MLRLPKLPRAVFCFAVALCAPFVAVAVAAEGLMTRLPAVVYDAPSLQARSLAILSGGQPLAQLSFVSGWRKVQTYTGDEGWVADGDTRKAAAGVVLADHTGVYADPNKSATAVFFVRRGVVLEMLGKPLNGWIHVLHADGETGYMEASLLWMNQ